MIDIVIFMAFAVVFFSLVMLIRNQLVYTARGKALKIISAKAQSCIDNGGGWDFIKYYDHLDTYGSYDSLMCDLTKWTFKQFYPDIEKFEVKYVDR